MQKVFITSNPKQTQKLGELLAQEIKEGPASRRRAVSASRGGEIICLTGELGSGKTTFTQGLLRGLKIEGPHTSPTFVVMKEYKPHPVKERGPYGALRPSPLLVKEREYRKIKNIYHIDAYRVTAKDILSLGWEEIFLDRNAIIIIEWADRIRELMPRNNLWINFEWINENKRKIIFRTEK